MPDCGRCGEKVEYVRMQSGQKLAVNPGVITVVRGAELAAGIARGRVPHWVTCSMGDDTSKRKVR